MFPMRTGFLPVSEPPSAGIPPWIEATLHVLLEKSVLVAAQYASDAGRDNLSSEDMVRGLKHQAFHFLDAPDLNERIEQYMNRDDSESDSESDSGSDSESDDCEDFSVATGSELAEEVNTCVEKWDSWEPETPQQEALKRAIDKAIERFKTCDT
jgi:hypothetical protein